MNYDEIMAILDEKDIIEELDDEDDLLDPTYVEDPTYALILSLSSLLPNRPTTYVEVDGFSDCSKSSENENESDELETQSFRSAKKRKKIVIIEKKAIHYR